MFQTGMKVEEKIVWFFNLGDWKMKVIRNLIILALVLCVASIGLSEVCAYDTFDYEPGELMGKSADRLGFVGEWDSGGGNPSQCTVESNSLNYANAGTAFEDISGSFQVIVPVWDGSRLGRFLDTDPSGPFADYINSYGTIGKAGQTIYISYLMQISHTTPFYAFELKRGGLGDPNGILDVGNDLPGSDLQVCAFRNRDTSEENIGYQFNWLGEATTDTELIVIRIDFGSTADDVTVYRNPSLDAEPTKSPDLVNAGWLDFDAISLAAWVDPAGRYAKFDEICIASTYSDALRFYNRPDQAQNPNPTDSAVEIEGTPGITLSWQAGQGVSPDSYDVYFSNNLNEVANEQASAFVGNTVDPNIDIGTIDTDTTYYWCVNQNTGSDVIQGTIWTFDSIKTLPQITAQPENQVVYAGETATFTVEVDPTTSPNYQWFDSNGALTDSGNISGADTDTLVITDANIIDEDDYYCEISNLAGTVTTEPASLIIKRLIGYWKLDQDADPDAAFQDYSGSGNDLQPYPDFAQPETFTWTEGPDGTAGSALVFDETFALGTKNADSSVNDIPVDDEPYTVALWFKTQKPASGLIGWGGFGNYNQTNVLNLQGDGWTIRNYWWDVDLDANRGYSLVDNAWHHVAATYDGEVRTIYIDGVETASDNPIDHSGTNENFLIGKANPENDFDWVNGALDEAKIYNYALSAVDVAHLYTDIAGGDVCAFPPVTDLDGDCRITFSDFALLAEEWTECGLIPACE